MPATSFYQGMKVCLNGEFGVVTDDFWIIGSCKEFGNIRWDTNKEADFEDWHGLFGNFLNMGGCEISSDHVFKFINDDGSNKSQ